MPDTALAQAGKAWVPTTATAAVTAPAPATVTATYTAPRYSESQERKKSEGHAPFRGSFRQLGYAHHPISCLHSRGGISLRAWLPIVTFCRAAGECSRWHPGWRWHGWQGAGARLRKGRN